MTTAIAVWGAALSTLLALVKGIEFWRDRPRLGILVHAHIDLDVPHPLFRIDVANRGRQPVTLLEAGFRVDAEYTIQKEGGPGVPMQPKIPLGDGEVRLVEPGGLARYEMLFPRIPAMINVDFPLRAYVIDSNNRTTYGGASPLFARMLDSGWKPPPDTDPKLLARSPEPLKPTPIYSRWRVWKPRGTRAPLWPLRR